MQAYVDWGVLLKDAPRNCWLTLNEDETKVVGHGETIEQAIEMARKAGVTEPILFWSPDRLVPRVLWRVL